MAQPVWVLSVDLNAKTATFQSGMADAARSAKGAFSEIKAGASEMTAETGGSMAEARHGVMLLGEEFGVHLPRGVTSFLASLGPVAAAMEAAFPFLAITVGATVLLEHLAKMREAGDKVASEWGHIDTEATKALTKTADELLTVQMQADKLAGNYLGALQKQLTLIDHQSLSELESAFDGLATKMDAVFKLSARGTLLSSLIGEGASNKVQAEFDKFKDQYDSLLSQGKDSEARGALVDEIIHAQEQLQKYQAMPQANSWVRDAVSDYGHLITQLQNVNRLQDLNSQIDAQKKNNATTEAQDAHPEDFHPELFAQAEAQKRVSLAETIALIKKEQEAANAASKLEVEGAEALAKGLKEIASEREKLAQDAGKEDAGHEMRMAQLQLEADREAGQMRMAQTRMTSQEILDMEMSFAAQEYNAKKEALNQEIAALDQYANNYENKKRALNNKILELDKQFDLQAQTLEDQSQQKELQTIQHAETQIEQAYARGFSQVIMGKMSFGKMMQQLDSQMASTALQNMMMSLAQQKWNDKNSQFSSAEKAAARAFAWAGNPLLGAPLAAATFAAVMALEKGGIVGGVGGGDIVPAMLTPGEAVIPKQMTEMLMNAAKFGNNSGGQEVHLHTHVTHNIQALDSSGMKEILTKHADLIAKHTTDHFRKMNR